MRISDWSSDVCSSDLLADLVAVAHVGNEKTTTYQTTRAEDAADFLWPCIGRNVEILGLHASEQITHATADDVRLEACILQAVQHLERDRKSTRLNSSH